MELIHGIFKLRILFSVFADFYDLLFPGSRKMKNLVLFLGSLVFYAWGEPSIFSSCFFLHIRLCVGKADRRIQREGSLQDLFCYVPLSSIFLSLDFLNMPIS